MGFFRLLDQHATLLISKVMTVQLVGSRPLLGMVEQLVASGCLAANFSQMAVLTIFPKRNTFVPTKRVSALTFQACDLSHPNLVQVHFGLNYRSLPPRNGQQPCLL